MKTRSFRTEEKIEVLRKQTLLIKDICVLYECGYQRAKDWANGYFRWYRDTYGHEPYNGYIFTSEFIKFSGYDERRLCDHV